MKALFELYDINHNNLISWKEYVCTVVLVMNGTVEEKLACMYFGGKKMLGKKKNMAREF